MFARVKHGVPRPKASVFGRSSRQFLSPLMLNNQKRAKYLGYLAGAFCALKDNGKSRVITLAYSLFKRTPSNSLTVSSTLFSLASMKACPAAPMALA